MVDGKIRAIGRNQTMQSLKKHVQDLDCYPKNSKESLAGARGQFKQWCGVCFEKILPVAEWRMSQRKPRFDVRLSWLWSSWV